MIPKVYTPAEIAEVLRVSQEDALKLISKGELSAFLVLGEPRVTEQALEELMRRPFSSSTTRPERKAQGQRERKTQLEQDYRHQLKSKIREVVPDLRLSRGRTYFTANGKQLILRVATKQVNQGYWFGFNAEFLRNGRPTFLILGLADRQVDLVIACDKFKAALDGLSVSRVGDRKLFIRVKAGSYYLTGKGIEQPIPLDSYVNAFHLLR